MSEDSHVVPVRISTDMISVLTQVRKSMDVSEDLVPSIHAHGQETPGIAAALTPDQAECYIKEINGLWSSTHCLNDQTRVILDDESYYIFLVAGHRRHQACEDINSLIANGELEAGTRFDGRYYVELRFGIDFEKAITIQFNENRHSQVPPAEEARAAWDAYRWMQKKTPKLTVMEFARRIGRRPDWVRNALRFCSLPASIQDFADGGNGKKRLPYGILVRLAYLGEKVTELENIAPNEDWYLGWIRKVVVEQLSTSKFSKIVSTYIKAKKAEHQGQVSLFGSVDNFEDDRPVRQVVARQLVPAMWHTLSYYQQLNQLMKDGVFNGENYLGPETDTSVVRQYSPGSPLRITSEWLKVISEILPDLENVAQSEGGRHRTQIAEGVSLIKQARKVVDDLTGLEPDSKP